LTYSPNGSRLISGGRDNAVVVWDAKYEKLTKRESHTSYVTHILYSPNGSYFVSVGQDATMRMYHGENGDDILTYRLDSPITSICFSPGSEQFATASTDGKVHLWTVRDNQPTFVLDVNPLGEFVIRLQYTQDGKHLITASNTHSVKVWDLSLIQSKNQMTVVWSNTHPLNLQTAQFGDNPGLSRPNELLLEKKGAKKRTSME